LASGDVAGNSGTYLTNSVANGLVFCTTVHKHRNKHTLWHCLTAKFHILATNYATSVKHVMHY